jgi:hypothetical protein
MANVQAVLCQCDSAKTLGQNFKTAAEDSTCAPSVEPGIDYAAFVGAAMFLATRSRLDIAFSLSAVQLNVLGHYTSARVRCDSFMLTDLTLILLASPGVSCCALIRPKNKLSFVKLCL